MHNVYIRGYGKCPKPDIYDIEDAFFLTRLCGSDIEKQAIKMVDNGTYIDSTWFEDRFGGKLYLDSLSTGCKAIIVVGNNPNKIIDTIECGPNAIKSLLNICNDGNVILSSYYRSGIPYIENGGGSKINVMLNGKHFTHIRDLNNYLNNPFDYDEED